MGSEIEKSWKRKERKKKFERTHRKQFLLLVSSLLEARLQESSHGFRRFSDREGKIQMGNRYAIFEEEKEMIINMEGTSKEGVGMWPVGPAVYY